MKNSPSVKRTPVRNLTVFTVFSFVIIVALAFAEFQLLRDSIQQNERHLRITTLLGRIALYDETLTMSAKMGAQSGSQEWEARYKDTDPLLTKTLAELASLTSKESVAPIQTANNALVEMETTAFALNRHNRHRESIALLSSRRYEDQKRLYAEGMDEVREITRQLLASERSRIQENSTTIFVSMIFLTLIAFSCWIAIIRVVRNWGDEKIEQLLQSDKYKALGETSTTLAHEISRPMATVRRELAQIRQQGFDPESWPKRVARMEACAGQVERLCRTLRPFTQELETTDLEPVLFQELVQDTLELCRGRFANHGIRIEERYGAPAIVRCRAVQISQVILNLFNNAFDAILAHPVESRWIRIELEVDSEFVHLSITDCGNGIPAAIVEKMMSPFFTTKTSGRGTGLGLSVSTEIASQHGGSLQYDSTSSNTRFLLELPVQTVRAITERSA